jgi:hypothetical protein
VHVAYDPIEGTATDLSIVPKNSTKCGVSECDSELSKMISPRSTRAVELCRKRVITYVLPFIKTNLKILFKVDDVHSLLFGRVTEISPYA